MEAMNVIKRDGSEQQFDEGKIRTAITLASQETVTDKPMMHDDIEACVRKVVYACTHAGHTVNVEEIQDFCENSLMRMNEFDVARHYIKYRYEKMLQRMDHETDDKILSVVEGRSEVAKVENSNKNPILASTQRDYIAGTVSRDITNRRLLPPDIARAHKEGIIHFHDTDYFLSPITNCELINLDDMLQNGTMIGQTLIEKPHSFSTACNVALQISTAVASSTYGGQTWSLTALAKFVDVTRKKVRQELVQELEDAGVTLTKEQEDKIVEDRVHDDVVRGVQTIQYQTITMSSTNGQAPFLSVCMYLNEADTPELKHDLAMVIEEVLKQRYQGVKNEKGVWVTPAFPKLLYFLEDDNIKEGQPYYYLTQLAAKCTAKRMVPDYISEKIMKKLKLSKGETEGNGDAYPCMGCRSFLTPDRSGNGWNNIANAKNYDGKPKYYGRFNQGVVTINLPDVALSSKGDMDEFWKIFDERLELCHRALRLRHERLLGTPSDVAPILWQYGAMARLKKGETIDKLLYGGYSTISLGYAGLYECVKYMTGKSHTSDEGHDFGIAVMQRMNDKCAEWKAAEDIDYSVYGTPIESTTYKFAKCLQRRFGIIPGVTDHTYITNSYHVNVREKIDAFTKLGFESEFQQLSPGGAVSYVEVPNMQDNLEAVMSVIQFIYDNIMYAELNTKSDYCQVCGYDGEIKIVEDDNGKLVWECPNCGNRDQSKMNVTRRTCGYLGSNFWCAGRTAEIKDRVLHL